MGYIPWEDYPVQLNGTFEGKRVHVDADGAAWVEIPWDFASEGEPPTTGIYPWKRQTVPLPKHMDDPVFREHAHAILCVSADGTKGVAAHEYGNPPYPPVALKKLPACAEEMARQYRDRQKP